MISPSDLSLSLADATAKTPIIAMAPRPSPPQRYSPSCPASRSPSWHQPETIIALKKCWIFWTGTFDWNLKLPPNFCSAAALKINVRSFSVLARERFRVTRWETCGEVSFRARDKFGFDSLIYVYNYPSSLKIHCKESESVEVIMPPRDPEI